MQRFFSYSPCSVGVQKLEDHRSKFFIGSDALRWEASEAFKSIKHVSFINPVKPSHLASCSDVCSNEHIHHSWGWCEKGVAAGSLLDQWFQVRTCICSCSYNDQWCPCLPWLYDTLEESGVQRGLRDIVDKKTMIQIWLNIDWWPHAMSGKSNAHSDRTHLTKVKLPLQKLYVPRFSFSHSSGSACVHLAQYKCKERGRWYFLHPLMTQYA